MIPKIPTFDLRDGEPSTADLNRYGVVAYAPMDVRAWYYTKASFVQRRMVEVFIEVRLLQRDGVAPSNADSRASGGQGSVCKGVVARVVPQRRKIPLKRALDEIEKFYGLPQGRIRRCAREGRSCTTIIQAGMYVAHEYADMSHVSISVAFHRKSAQVVIQNIKTLRMKRRKDHRLDDEIKQIEQRLDKIKKGGCDE